MRARRWRPAAGACCNPRANPWTRLPRGPSGARDLAHDGALGVGGPQGQGLSQTLIGNCLSDLAQLRQVSGSRRESVLREAFKDLLKAWGRQHDLVFVPE